MKVAPLCLRTLLNTVLAVLNGITALTQSSLWHLSMMIFFIILTIMGSYVAVCINKPGMHSARKVMLACGIFIIYLAAATTFFKLITVGDALNDHLSPAFVIILAAITFATAIIAIVDAHKARKGNDYEQAYLRISIASMLGAMMTLEMHMLGTFAKPGQLSTVLGIEIVSGAVVVALLLSMGIWLIVKSRKAEG